MARRRHPRYSATVTVIDGSDAEGQSYVTRNLSVGGLFLLCNRRWPVGEELALTLDQDGRQLAVRARVTHIFRDGVGFSFCDPGAEFLRELRSMLEALAPIEMESPGERRDSDRLPVKIQAAWVYGEVERQDPLRNLSANGAFVVSDKQPPVDSTVTVYLPAYTFSRESDKPSEVRGSSARVVRHEDRGFAVEFVDPSAEFKMAVRDLFAQNKGD